MNKNRIAIGLAVALLIGILASRFVYRQMRVASVPKTVPTVQVVVATAPMTLGTRLQANQVKTIEWPSDTPMAGSFSRVEDCVGRALLTNIAANEPILDQKLAPREAGGGLPAVIPEGMRALSVRVDDVVGVAGFVVPGTMVDVLATGDPGGTNGGDTVTRTILEDVRVLAAGQQTTQDKGGKPQTVSVVTLLVNPDQADRLTLASNEGRLRLALRNTIDTKQLDPPAVFRSTVFYGQLPPKPKPTSGVQRHSRPPKPAVDPPYTLELIKGDKKETESFGLR
ncbi:MAG TPA: Flp pilus assembly protein CpaB [Terriglobia bacterium]|nr:Flp pilus assembly protein CpaB [Terriglobia bacterium]